jgi:predicted Zn-dependent protease with MMP-like domain
MSILDDIDVQIDRFDKLIEAIYNIIVDKYDCATPEFVQDVRCVYLNKVRSSIRDMVNYHSLNKSLECVINDIPIHFGKQKVYKDYDDGEYLGLYRRNNDGTREIILFEDAIQAEAKGDNDYLKNLIWKVIIHEYAHAMMDTLQDNKIKSQDPKLYKYREESLANAFALKVLKSSGSGFSKIEDFVKYQPEEYRYGLDLYESEDLLKMMEFWREMKIEGNKRY